jgi:protein-S-isoprenylcysteine O-methyltransferase Ste14
MRTFPQDSGTRTLPSDQLGNARNSGSARKKSLREGHPMNRLLGAVYGLIAYSVFLVSFLYAIGFVANLWVPKSIDAPDGGDWLSALAINALLLGLFAVQHSVMARPAFKSLWTRIVPKSVERATYVLLSSLILLFIFWQWRAMPTVVWHADSRLLVLLAWGTCGLGWLVVLLSTFMINHFDLFGLRQVTLVLLGREYTNVPFQMRGFYRLVRHPIMTGFIIAFWATPSMTVGHLVFAFATTAYILIALRFEESDLMDAHRETYKAYRERVPMLVPRVAVTAGTSNRPTYPSQ